ncbi:hypothetical protein N8H74_18410 [Pseudomonas sp. B2M1-30]|uniref:hypothetical protein n=1 Tax=Pseudomonas TaxID=286 RepID=UPI0021C8202A|nr:MULTISPECIES: hypothetical protein [Pseudomonas]MCU0120239.1 hypothetical protein [Pseudomonas sp. B2M1-30]MCU7260931.1 hypothetical protein [Pseudomonas koreensis]
MRPKPPPAPNVPKVNPPAPGPGRLRPDADLPLIHPPVSGTPTRPTANPEPGHAIRPGDPAEVPRVAVSDLPTVRPETSAGLNGYLLNQAFLRNLQAADTEGFRFIVNRRFVDIKDLGTVYVEFDATAGAYRARDLYNKLPPGPVLFRNDGEPTWSLLPSSSPETRAAQKRPSADDAGDQPGSKRPANPASDQALRPAVATVYPLTIYARSYFRMRLSQSGDGEPSFLYGYEKDGERILLDAPPPEYVRGPKQHTSWDDLMYYAAAKPGPDGQGYYRIAIKTDAASDTSYTLYGFKDANDHLVKVDPPVAGIDARPRHLTGWTDHEIWRLYRLHGADIPRFRADAQASGTRPEWARPVKFGNPRKELLRDSLRWLYPQMTREQLSTRLRAYNLSPGQHARLRQDLLDNPRVIPPWAEQHKLRSLDANEPSRFAAMQQEIEPLLLPLRNGTLTLKGLHGLDKMVTRDFLEAFVNRLGYRRNTSNCLYRTDIPALFRADERTLFELVDDGRMLPRMTHAKGGTSEKPISATVGLQLVWTYAGKGTTAPDPEHLRYNNQKNKYPGKRPGESDNDSGESDNEWSEASDVELDAERNYETIRHQQKINFIYLIDTRNLEVVLREENILLNGSAEKNGANFPEDENEALLSASRRGIGSQRIWLLDSTLGRAAKIDDIAEQADYSLRRSIEDNTHNGQYNQAQYDALINAAARAGKPVLRMVKGFDTFANDIVWPE